MSRALDYADQMAEHLRAELPWCRAYAGAEIPLEVIVDRRADLTARLKAVEATANGGSITILCTGGRNPDRKSKKLNMGARFSIFVATRPLFLDGKVTCHDLTEAAMEALHGWEPHAGKSPVSQRVEILDYELTTTKKLAVYEITAEVIRLKR